MTLRNTPLTTRTLNSRQISSRISTHSALKIEPDMWFLWVKSWIQKNHLLTYFIQKFRNFAFAEPNNLNIFFNFEFFKPNNNKFNNVDWNIDPRPSRKKVRTQNPKKSRIRVSKLRLSPKPKELRTLTSFTVRSGSQRNEISAKKTPIKVRSSLIT